MAYAAKVIHMDEHRTSGPQLEDGHVRIANELYDAILAKVHSFRHLKVALAVIRKTYGFNKKEDDITISQLAEMTGIHRNHVGTTLRELETMRIINAVRAGRHGLMVGINKHHNEWTQEPVKPRGVSTKSVATKSNQIGSHEQPKQLSASTKSVVLSNQNVAHNNQSQQPIPTTNPKKKEGTPAAQSMPLVPEWMPADLWADFIAARLEAKKPLTATAAKRMLAKIERLKAEGHCPSRLLENSILNRWTDVYPKPETMTGKPAAQSSALKPDNRGLVAGLPVGGFL